MTKIQLRHRIHPPRPLAPAADRPDMPKMTDTAATDTAARPPAATPQAETPGPKPQTPPMPKEYGGPKGPEPTRYGDWEVKGRCTDF